MAQAVNTRTAPTPSRSGVGLLSSKKRQDAIIRMVALVVCILGAIVILLVWRPGSRETTPAHRTPVTAAR